MPEDQVASKSPGKLIPLVFEGKPVRVITEDGEAKFVLTDVCGALGIKNSRDIASRLSPNQKGVALVDSPGGPQNMIVVNEPGLYMAVFQSRKAKAKMFQSWVTDEVLPSIRRTGSYTTGRSAGAKAESVHGAVVEATSEIARDVAETAAGMHAVLKIIDGHKEWSEEALSELRELAGMILPETRHTIASLRAKLEKSRMGEVDIPEAAFSRVEILGSVLVVLFRPELIEGASHAMLQSLAVAKTREEGAPIRVLFGGVDDECRRSWDAWARERDDAEVHYGVGGTLALGIGRYRRHPVT